MICREAGGKQWQVLAHSIELWVRSLYLTQRSIKSVLIVLRGVHCPWSLPLDSLALEHSPCLQMNDGEPHGGTSAPGARGGHGHLPHVGAFRPGGALSPLAKNQAQGAELANSHCDFCPSCRRGWF